MDSSPGRRARPHRRRNSWGPIGSGALNLRSIVHRGTPETRTSSSRQGGVQSFYADVPGCPEDHGRFRQSRRPSVPPLRTKWSPRRGARGDSSWAPARRHPGKRGHTRRLGLSGRACQGAPLPPFSAEHFLKALPDGEAHCRPRRTKEPGAEGDALPRRGDGHQGLQACRLRHRAGTVSPQGIHPAMVRPSRRTRKATPKKHFTVGIEVGVTH